jgi:hypothetical protein
VRGEPLCVDRGGGDDQLEVRTPGEQRGQVAEQEVDVQAAFVGLVDDDRVVAGELAVALDLGQQDPVRHQPHHRRRPDAVGEAHRVADGVTEGDLELLGDPLGHRARRDPPRLGVPDQPVDAPAQLEADLRQLGRLAGPGLTRDHDHLVVADGCRDLVPTLRDRQLRRIADGRCRDLAPRRTWRSPAAG